MGIPFCVPRVWLVNASAEIFIMGIRKGSIHRDTAFYYLVCLSYFFTQLISGYPQMCN